VSAAPAPASAPGTSAAPVAPRPLVLAAWVIPAVVLVQALLAGQGWFVDGRLFGLHGGLGHGVLLVSAVVATFAWLVGSSRVVAIVSTLVTLGLIGQTGLGYAGRRGELAVASAVHIPLGVALLGASVAVAVLLTVHARSER
jgi:hypothetical protein